MIDPHRITMRDVKSYCGVLIDDNNTKRVCRLYFNTRQKYVGVVDDQRVEERIPIENVDALYYLAERLREAATPYV